MYIKQYLYFLPNRITINATEDTSVVYNLEDE